METNTGFDVFAPQRLNVISNFGDAESIEAPLSEGTDRHENGDRIRIVVVDDQKFVLQSLLQNLSGQNDFDVIGTADNGSDAISKIRRDAPDIALVDVEMPDMTGLDITRRLLQENSNTKVIIFSMYDDESYIRDAIDAGARGYLLKTTPKEELAQAIRFVQRGYLQLGPGLYEKLDSAPSDAPLTAKRTQAPIVPSPQEARIITEKPQREEEKRGIPWKWLIAGVVAIAATSVAALALLPYFLKQSGADAPVVSQPPAPPPSISALGFIEPEGEVVTLSAPAFMEGSRVSQLLKQQGEMVTKGEPVAILDNHDRLKAALQQAQQQVEVAQAELAQVQAGAKQGDIQASGAELSRVRAELRGQIQAQEASIAQLEAQLAGDISTQEAVILENQADSNNAELECNRFEQLLVGGATSVSQRDEVCLRKDTANQRLNQAKSTLERIKRSQQQQINQAKANLQRTKDTLDFEASQANFRKDAVAEVRAVDVEVARQNLAAAQVAVQRAKADFDQSYVRSPINGRVIEINSWPGELVSQADGIAELGRTDQMFVSAEVYETDISRVKLGQKAIIRADGVFEELTGTVDKIGIEIGRPNVLGTDPVRDADVRVVEVKVRLSPSDSRKVQNLTNLQVNVIISVDS